MAIHNNDRVVDIPTTANNPDSPVVTAVFELGETEEIVRPKALDRLLLEKAGQTASVVQGKKKCSDMRRYLRQSLYKIFPRILRPKIVFFESSLNYNYV